MDTQAEPLLPSGVPPQSPASESPPPHASPIVRKTPWLALAAASGSCAAFNGVFAKLTTTELTRSWSTSLAHALHLSTPSRPLEYLIRGLFFVLNLGFNALMWALFTAALTRASSTTQVSIINTSANFMLTALLGLVIFGERLPPLWWLGAALLVVGNVVIGRREEGGKGGKEEDIGEGDAVGLDARDGHGYRDDGNEGQGATGDGAVVK